MKAYTVSQARARFAEVLDRAESGQPVVIERGGVRFELVMRAPKRRPARRRPVLEIIDPAVAAGDWTWKWDEGGVRFAPHSVPQPAP